MYAETHKQVPARLSSSSFLLQRLVLQCSGWCLLGMHACVRQLRSVYLTAP